MFSLYVDLSLCLMFFFFFNDTATTEIYTLSLHDALPILERLVDPLELLGGDTAPGVGDADLKIGPGGARLDPEPAARRHGIEGVGEQVEEELLEPTPPGADLGQIVGNLELQGNTRPFHARAQNGQRPLEDLRQRRADRGATLRARQLQHAVEDPLADLRRLLDLQQILRQHL